MNRERHTDEHTAALEAERDALIKALKQLLADPGNAGVPDVIFRRGWDGVRLYRADRIVARAGLAMVEQDARHREQVDPDRG